MFRKIWGIKRIIILFWMLLGLILSAEFSLEATDSADLFERAKNLYDVKDYRAALSLFDAILSADSCDGIALDFSGWCCRYTGDLSSAERRFNRALEILKEESAKWVHVGLGETFLQAGLYDKALLSFENGRAVASGDSEVILRALKGSVLCCMAADLERAKRLILEIAEIAPDEAEAFSRDIFAAKETLSGKNSSVPKGDTPTDVLERQKSLLDTTESPEPVISRDGDPKPTHAAVTPSPAKPPKKTPRTKASSKKQNPVASPSGQTARNEVLVCGIPLGEKGETAISKIENIGVKIGGASAFIKEGQNWLPIEGLKDVDSDAFFRNSAENIRTFVVQFRGRFLSVVRAYDFKRGDSSLREFTDLEERGRAFLNGKGRLSHITSSITVTEMGTIISREYAVWLQIRNNLDGSCSVEIQHVYLPLFSDFLSDCGRGKKD